MTDTDCNCDQALRLQEDCAKLSLELIQVRAREEQLQRQVFHLRTRLGDILDLEDFIKLLPEKEQRDLFFEIASYNLYAVPTADEPVAMMLREVGLVTKPQEACGAVRCKLSYSARHLLERLWPDDGW